MLNIADTVIIAIITSITSLIVAKWNNDKRNKDEEVKDATRRQYQDDRDDYFDEKLADIEKKLDEHNGYARKFESIEISLTKLQKDVEYLTKGVKNDNTTRRTRKSTKKTI